MILLVALCLLVCMVAWAVDEARALLSGAEISGPRGPAEGHTADE